MNTNLLTDSPREDWTLEELGQFAQQIAKRTAHNAWLIGRAYTLAKKLAKSEGKKIETWQKEWLPFLSQPTLSRYEAVSRLPEEEVMGKGLTEVYRLLGLVPKQTGPAEAGAPTSPSPAGESPQKTTPAEAEDAPTAPAPEGESQQPATFKVLPVEPDSLLKRLAPVVALLTSIVRDLPSLDTTLDATPAIEDATALLRLVRAGLARPVAA